MRKKTSTFYLGKIKNKYLRRTAIVVLLFLGFIVNCICNAILELQEAWRCMNFWSSVKHDMNSAYKNARKLWKMKKDDE